MDRQRVMTKDTIGVMERTMPRLRTPGRRESVERVILMLHALLMRYEQPELADALGIASGYQLIWRWRDRRNNPTHSLQTAITRLYEDEFGLKKPEDVLPKDVVDKVRSGVTVQLEELRVE